MVETLEHHPFSFPLVFLLEFWTIWLYTSCFSISMSIDHPGVEMLAIILIEMGQSLRAVLQLRILKFCMSITKSCPPLNSSLSLVSSIGYLVQSLFIGGSSGNFNSTLCTLMSAEKVMSSHNLVIEENTHISSYDLLP